MTETELLHIIAQACPSPPAPVGIGDDCATIINHAYDYVLKVDSVIEHVHFTLATPGEFIGRKAICRVMSDFAAMGGAAPVAFLVSITLASRHNEELVSSIYTGISQTLDEFGGKLVGGETSHYKELPNSDSSILPLNISVTGLASINSDRVINRQGANSGDGIFVTGELGYTLESGHHLDFEPRLAQAQWIANHSYASAMMDLSDGLAMDLPRLCKQSECHYQLDIDSIPCVAGSNTQQALSLGEDYELLFAVPKAKIAQIKVDWAQQFPNLKLTQIGEIYDLNQPCLPNLAGGWDCFSQ